MSKDEYTILCLSGEAIKVKGNTVGDIMKSITKLLGIPQQSQRLFWAGKNLTHTSKMSNFVKGKIILFKNDCTSEILLSELSRKCVVYAERYQRGVIEFDHSMKRQKKRELRLKKKMQYLSDTLQTLVNDKIFYANSRQYVLAQQCKDKIPVIKEDIALLRNVMREIPKDSTEIEDTRSMRKEITEALAEGTSILKCYFESLMVENQTAKHHFVKILDVLRENSKKAISSIKEDLGKKVIVSEKNMLIMAKKESFLAANQLKLRIKKLKRDIENLMNFDEAVANYKQNYLDGNSTFQIHLHHQMFFEQLNKNGEIEDILNFRAVAKECDKTIQKIRERQSKAEFAFVSMNSAMQLLDQPDDSNIPSVVNKQVEQFFTMMRMIRNVEKQRGNNLHLSLKDKGKSDTDESKDMSEDADEDISIFSYLKSLIGQDYEKLILRELLEESVSETHQDIQYGGLAKKTPMEQVPEFRNILNIELNSEYHIGPSKKHSEHLSYNTLLNKKYTGEEKMNKMSQRIFNCPRF